MKSISETSNISIIGGCGHVGLPLGISFALQGNRVNLVEINEMAVEKVNQAQMPFLEDSDAQIKLKTVVENGNLKATLDKSVLQESDVVVFVTGTPVDEHLNPKIHEVLSVINQYLEFLENKLVVLRSTIYPGTVQIVQKMLNEKNVNCSLAFCPERVAQGYGLSEISNLPQIISATTDHALNLVKELFLKLTNEVVEMDPIEAELAKLMTNSWRYLEFAIANQFYVMAESRGVDFYKIFDKLKHNYPRAQHFAAPGLAAGPCLFKDTMQLSAYHKSNFFLGHSAMLVNEGLPSFLVYQLEEQLGELSNKNIAILGMTFKANNDDTRESLSFKLKKELEAKLANVIVSDVYLPETTSYNQAIEQADAVVLGVPHREYKELIINKPFVDCWGVWRQRYDK
jgi:UDP-N-acetyl-D-mannosaminuronic acid dehydrogenase